MEPAATLRLAAAPAEFWGVPAPAVEEPELEPEARPVPEPEAVGLALLEAAEPVPDVGWFRTMVVELLALTTRVRVELPVPATGMV
jgi:hypothetical protein